MLDFVDEAVLHVLGEGGDAVAVAVVELAARGAQEVPHHDGAARAQDHRVGRQRERDAAAQLRHRAGANISV